jgi:hypothetical protein
VCARACVYLRELDTSFFGTHLFYDLQKRRVNALMKRKMKTMGHEVAIIILRMITDGCFLLRKTTVSVPFHRKCSLFYVQFNLFIYLPVQIRYVNFLIS